MKNKVLIIGNDNHSEKFKIYFSLCTDFVITHIFDLDIIPEGNYLYCIVSEPYFLDKNDIDKLCCVKAEMFIFEKMISKFMENYYLLDEKLFNKWIPYHSRLFDYFNISISKEYMYGDVYIKWPCYMKNMKKIEHCLPNLIDFIESTIGLELNNFTIVYLSEKVYFNDDKNNIHCMIYNTFEDDLVNVNGYDIDWPNFIDCMGNFFSFINSNNFIFSNINYTKKIFKWMEEVLILMNIYEINYEFNRNIIFKKFENMVLGFNSFSGETLEFNDIGSDIFILLSENTPIPKIIDNILLDYSGNKDEILEDLESFLIELNDLGVIRIV